MKTIRIYISRILRDQGMNDLMMVDWTSRWAEAVLEDKAKCRRIVVSCVLRCEISILYERAGREAWLEVLEEKEVLRCWSSLATRSIGSSVNSLFLTKLIQNILLWGQNFSRRSIADGIMEFVCKESLSEDQKAYWKDSHHSKTWKQV